MKKVIHLKKISNEQKVPKIVYIFAILGGFAGLLYGYDSGAIALALPAITDEFGLNTQEKGLVVSFLLLGALPSIIAATIFEKKIERRNLLIWGGFIFIIGSIGCAIAPNTPVLLAFRFVLGIAAGIANMYGLIYLSELAPSNIRGFMASLYQFSVNVGILVSFIIGAANFSTGAWRWTLGLGVVPALIFAIGMMLSPQSPRWLIRDGQLEKARRVLQKVRMTNLEVEEEISDIELSLVQQSSKFSDLFKNFRPIVILGLTLTVFQVFTGINAAVYYAPEIFQHLGIAHASIAANYGVGSALVLSTLIALPFIDKLGRKKLLIISMIGQIPSCLGMALFGDHALIAIISIFLFVFSFGLGLGPVFWSYIPEIFPLRARALGMGLITFAQYTLNFIFSLTFPMFLLYMGNKVFLIYALLSLIAIFYIHFKCVETKGKSLEEIERYWLIKNKKGKLI
ncbi:sugar porter family MFS transporter [Staphylococcus croceilyticus]|uniref:Sugar porter family MFS transporter n=1 Tax=Staphylococcus croceilyticus TaxID=319942 RepID=A0ABY2KKJ7_9STAP|nr:sugar porter family MFS transporter [Staphylococcus croceilyticus]PNZ69477.1 MFS transporter [Staphylococcus croceilyticus]TGA81005.1 sugar porter family MFS transporter [Staphylococcus croceilyticus]